MKKYLVVTILVFGFLLLGFTTFSTIVAGQEDKTPKLDETSERHDDIELARTIRRLANWSSEGLIQERTLLGGMKIDFQGRFQNVLVSRIDEFGDQKVACITGLGEANLFFKRNLETGEPLPNDLYRTESLDEIAARHGMTTQEYVFYRNLIADAERNTFSPNASTITIVNNDGAGEGFNDATVAAPVGGNNGLTLGQQRLNLFNFAANIWASFLDSGVPILVRSQFDPLTCTPTSATLGSAGPLNGFINFPNAVFPNTIYHVALANKQAGADLDAGNPDINATFNSNLNGTPGCLGSRTFYLGFDNPMPAPSNTTNLLVVLLHEMGHGLGFSSFGVSSTTGAFNNGLPDTYTTFMRDNTTGITWNAMTDAQRLASITNVNNVLWTGPNVSIASGFLTAGRTNGQVQLFTPSPFQGGSSVSHFSTAASPNLLMEPAINLDLPGTLDLTRQQMRDIGWYRDTTADLTPDTITTVTPSGGTIVIGSTATVNWTNTGGFNRNVIVELSTDAGATFPTQLGADVPNFSGSLMTFNFTVPNMPTTQGRIRVREDNFVTPVGISAANFNISGPSAASVSISGQVLSATGIGVYRASISVVDPGGQTRQVLSNQFGYYNFDSLPVGETYTLTVNHKQYRFTPQVLTISDEIRGLNFIALP